MSFVISRSHIFSQFPSVVDNTLPVSHSLNFNLQRIWMKKSWLNVTDSRPNPLQAQERGAVEY